MSQLHKPEQDGRTQQALVEQHDVHGYVRQTTPAQRVRKDFQKYIEEIERERDPDNGDAHVYDGRIGVEDTEGLPPEVKQDGRQHQRITHAENQRRTQAALYPVIESGPHILSGKGHHGLAQGDQRHIEQQLDTVVGSKGRNSHHVEPVDEILYEYIGKGHHHSLQARRQTDADDFPHQRPVNGQFRDADDAIVEQVIHGNNGRKHLGQDRRPGYREDTVLHIDNKQIIGHYVNDAAHQLDQHGGL